MEVRPLSGNKSCVPGSTSVVLKQGDSPPPPGDVWHQMDRVLVSVPEGCYMPLVGELPAARHSTAQDGFVGRKVGRVEVGRPYIIPSEHIPALEHFLSSCSIHLCFCTFT